MADASSQMQFAAGIARGLHSDHATAPKALVSSFQGLTRHDYVFRPALVLTDALAGHADDLVATPALDFGSLGDHQHHQLWTLALWGIINTTSRQVVGNWQP